MKKLIFIILFFSLFIGCKKDETKEPGPISVENTIVPSVVNNGSSIIWTIKVKNYGDEVEIDRIHIKEEFISGWAEGQGSAELDLPITNSIIGKNETRTIYSRTIPVYNTGIDDIGVRNSVNVYSSGGDDSDVVVYTITTDKSASLTPKASGVVGS